MSELTGVWEDGWSSVALAWRMAPHAPVRAGRTWQVVTPRPPADPNVRPSNETATWVHLHGCSLGEPMGAAGDRGDDDVAVTQQHSDARGLRNVALPLQRGVV